MSRLGTMAVTFLLLGAADAVVTYRLDGLHGRHVTRWASDTEWSEALGDETWHLWPARPAATARRASWCTARSPSRWTLAGKRLANGIIPWGTNVGGGGLHGRRTGRDRGGHGRTSRPPRPSPCRSWTSR